MTRALSLKHGALAVACLALLAACGSDDDDAGTLPEETRPQDSRSFTVANPTATTFAAMAPASGDVVDMSTTSRWAGTLDGAAYLVEVPANWNGKLVMYAHGYAGTGTTLNVGPPSIRRHLIQQGYAWAASSYSANFYDVRAGVEDTNALALEFTKIASANGRALTEPSKRFIIGHSMGGHISAAAVEAEAIAQANHKVRYHGAVPMCGVVGDTELFNEFGAMQLTAQALAGVPANPIDKWADVKDRVTSTLFTTFPSVPTAKGQQYLSVLMNLTGGPRPMFDLAIAFGGSFAAPWGVFGGDGTLDGILTRKVIDTNAYTYTITGDPSGSAALNASVQKLTADPQANRLRRDGLRWVPKVNGEINVPVVSIHTLGDLFVPFSMQQTYAQRAAAKGTGQWLVQRAIRGVSHCDFTVAEQVEAFDAMTTWEAGGARPAGDDVLAAATVASPTYGCTWTRNDVNGPDESATTKALRPPTVANSVPCP